MAGRRWQPANPAALEQVIATAASVRDVAERLKCDPGTLRRYCREHNIDLTELARRGTLRAARMTSTVAGSPVGDIDQAVAERIERDTVLDRLRAERDEYKRLYDEAVRRIRDEEDLARTLAKASVRPLPSPKLPPRGKASDRRPAREAVLLLSDWQLGQVVRENDTGGLNTYDWPTAGRRLRRWLDAAVGNIINMRNAYAVDRVVLAMLGDMVEGHDVFSGQAYSLDKDAALQALDGSALFADAISELITRLWPVTIDIYCVPGNHGKPGGRRSGNMPTTLSFDHLFYEILKLRLANAPVREWGIEPCGRLLFMSAGTPVLMTHGDEVRGWGGFPYYGLDKAHGRLLQELDTVFHVWLLGHWHAAAVLPSGRGMRLVNGNAVGANRLTTAAVLGATAPTQSLMYLSRDLGVAELALLYLDQEQATVKPRIYAAEAL